MADNKVCLECGRTSEQIPLVQLEFKGKDFWICPQHIPVLIHDPQKLEGKLPDAENMTAG
jgi:hypothetical protein